MGREETGDRVLSLQCNEETGSKDSSSRFGKKTEGVVFAAAAAAGGGCFYYRLFFVSYCFIWFCVLVLGLFCFVLLILAYILCFPVLWGFRVGVCVILLHFVSFCLGCLGVDCCC